MNPIIVGVILVVILSLLRVSVVLSLIVGAVVAGLAAGMKMPDIVTAFNSGLGDGAIVALSYGTLGAFAVVLSRTGVTQQCADVLIRRVNTRLDRGQSPKSLIYLILFGLILMGFAAESIVPIHIAFIPIVIPPLLALFNKVGLDRRVVACTLTFAVVTMYMALPIGFGEIYLNDILVKNINVAGKTLDFAVDKSQVVPAMAIPCAGMLGGLLLAVFFSYRKKRHYDNLPIEGQDQHAPPPKLKTWQKLVVLLGLVLALVTQLWTDSMIFGALMGFSIVSMSGIIKWSEHDDFFLQGMRLMAMISFIMITANGFSAVINATGAVPDLVQKSVELMGNNKGLAIFVMLAIGLFVTMGIGSSFSTVPILTAIYVPFCAALGLSPMATIALIGTAGALGDAGSPASDSTLGPTAGLNVDGQHNHIWDTVVPTFLHFNLPLLAAGWVAAMIL